MKIRDYLKDKIVFILVNIILFIILSVIMIYINVDLVVIFCTFCIWFLPLLSYIIIQLIQNKRYYDEVQSMLETLDKKYLLPEVLNDPSYIEGKIFINILKEISKDMHENVKYYRDLQGEYREYIETWVHEIKTPIASTKLIIENNNNSITNKIDFQISRIENFIEQVLYYSRSEEVSKDYIINEIRLDIVMNNVIRRNSRDFISKKIKLDIGDINKTIYSDSKWAEYILNQIIGNSIKYSKKDNATIRIDAIEKENSIVLTIQDNGIGIIERDINRVFEKGFTGENGRRFGKATGMGLYLSKKLCSKLGLGINIESKIKEGTIVSIIFPLGKLRNF